MWGEGAEYAEHVQSARVHEHRGIRAERCAESLERWWSEEKLARGGELTHEVPHSIGSRLVPHWLHWVTVASRVVGKG